MPFSIAFRPAVDQPLADARVPHLDPIRRAIESGQDRVVRLPDGRRIRPSQIVSVARYDEGGRLIEAWEVRSHGPDGRHDWQRAWREAAAATEGITSDDPRLSAVMAALDGLDAAYRERNVLAWLARRAVLDRAVAGVRMEVA
ncbi:MAG: hypothetical protein KatS3mg082_2613 [Nitrospiraceae bacterium]|nr:MAG: hypothetical protein KatS3mg082_2613 [Nitrospiraceae bacterium]